jgi:hypothetical protein
VIASSIARLGRRIIGALEGKRIMGGKRVETQAVFGLTECGSPLNEEGCSFRRFGGTGELLTLGSLAAQVRRKSTEHKAAGLVSGSMFKVSG